MSTNSEPSWAAPDAPAAYPPASGASPDAVPKGRRSRARREPGYGQAPKAASGSSYPGTGPLPSSSELRREAQRTARIAARTTSPEEDVERARALLKRVTSTFSERVVGQQRLRVALVSCLIAGGHVLLESVPGLAKTTAAQTLAAAVSGSFRRIQCTPDLMPNDIVGTQIYSYETGKFTTQLGPVHANVVLLDEINRSSAKTQSAMLEAMQEHQVTIGEQTFTLPDPFLVMATQNPIEQEGTYALPEAQVDRFMLKVVIDYPTLEEEKLVIRENLQETMPVVHPVISANEILEARRVVKDVYIDDKIMQYIADIVFATRYPERYQLPELKQMITFGGSPRASINLAKASRAYAFIKHRGYVVPEDVRAVAHDVLRHRIGLSYEAEATDLTTEKIISEIINKIQVP